MNFYHLIRIPDDRDDPSGFYEYYSSIPDMTIGIFDSIEQAKKVAEDAISIRMLNRLSQINYVKSYEIKWKEHENRIYAVVTLSFKNEKCSDLKDHKFVIATLTLNEVINLEGYSDV